MLINRTRDPEWLTILEKLKGTLGKRPTLNGILFLIGVQELGKGLKQFSKEEKQDLMHVAICRLLSQSGYYLFEGKDEDGWPHYKNIVQVPHFDLIGQEEMLQKEIKIYFKDL